MFFMLPTQGREFYYVPVASSICTYDSIGWNCTCCWSSGWAICPPGNALHVAYKLAYLFLLHLQTISVAMITIARNASPPPTAAETSTTMSEESASPSPELGLVVVGTSGEGVGSGAINTRNGLLLIISITCCQWVYLPHICGCKETFSLERIQEEYISLKEHWTSITSSPTCSKKSWDFYTIRSVGMSNDCMLSFTV